MDRSTAEEEQVMNIEWVTVDNRGWEVEFNTRELDWTNMRTAIAECFLQRTNTASVRFVYQDGTEEMITVTYLGENATWIK